MAFEKILVLDDEPIIRDSLSRLLEKRSYTVTVTGACADAEEAMAKEVYDLVFMDLRLPDGDGAELLDKIKKEPDSPYAVIMTGYGTIESAVRCMRLGAFDYLIKPFKNSEIEFILKKAEEYDRLLRIAFFRGQQDLDDSQLLGECEVMVNLRKLIRRVARTDATVLIQGESGTGKELVASEIHRASERASRPFIRVNCAAMSETLIESEFFGHEKGAFTGATQRREGRFELADQGTILLDEISEISPALQAKLLRVLQEREFERVGGAKTIKVDVRVLATTNRDLKQCVEAGEFREDLYYRLNVFPIINPALRERREDIPLLSRQFANSLARKHHIKIPGFTREAMDDLVSHDWPGNVRELRNVVERAVILSEDGKPIEASAVGLRRGGIDLDPTPAMASGKPESTGASVVVQQGDTILPMEEVEKSCILHALEVTKGNRTHAAEKLGISLRTLRNKIAKYRTEGVVIPESVAT